MVYRHNQALLQTQIEIQEQTLKTISQEIHDNIGQVLSLAKLNLNTFENIESESNQLKINDTKQLVSKAIVDLRGLSRSMFGGQVGDVELPQAIANELTILQNSGQYQTAIEIIGEPYKLEPQKEMVLFRIMQEAMNNAVKHAKATKITVRLSFAPGTFILLINDDGDGFDVGELSNGKHGIGLKSMQNRAALIGGELNLESSTGRGTTVTISLNNLKT